MNCFKKKSNIIGLLMFVIMIMSAILLRIDNIISNLVGLILFPVVIVLCIILLKIDKN